MSIEIREQFVEAKSADRVCEDMIVTTDDFLAVIDGASDVTGAQFDGKTGGRFAAEVVASVITELPPTIDARTFADTLAERLRAEVHDTVGTLSKDVRWPNACVACASVYRREVWRIGDCNVTIGGVENLGGKRVDDAAYGFRAAVNAALLAKGMPLSTIVEDDPGAHATRPLLDNQQHLANVVGSWGFGCINGLRVPDDYLEVLTIPASPTEVIITSDGFPVVAATLQESEAALRALIERDPAAVGELWSVGKSTKSGANAPDDRAYLRFEIA